MGLYDVVTCGFPVAPWSQGAQGTPAADGDLGEGGALATLPEPASPDFLDEAFGLLADRDPDRRVLLVHASGRRETHQLGVLRGVLRTPLVVPVPLPLPVTGLAATATWLRALADHGLSAGTVLSRLGAVTAHLPTYVATTSVAGLEMAGVRLRHHMLSWLPGTVFSIAMAGETVVSAGAAKAPAASADGSATVVWHGDQKLASRLTATVPSGAEHARLAADDHEGSRWSWTRAYEHCVMPHDVATFAETLRASALGRCPHCAEPMDRVCAFCLSQEGVLA